MTNIQLKKITNTFCISIVKRNFKENILIIFYYSLFLVSILFINNKVLEYTQIWNIKSLIHLVLLFWIYYIISIIYVFSIRKNIMDFDESIRINLFKENL